MAVIPETGLTERTLMTRDSLRPIIIISKFLRCPLKCFILILNFPLTRMGKVHKGLSLLVIISGSVWSQARHGSCHTGLPPQRHPCSGLRIFHKSAYLCSRVQVLNPRWVASLRWIYRSLVDCSLARTGQLRQGSSLRQCQVVKQIKHTVLLLCLAINRSQPHSWGWSQDWFMPFVKFLV